jgi:hypothetical protein
MSEEQSQSGRCVAQRGWNIAFGIIEFLGFIPVLGIFGLLPDKHLGKDFWPVGAIIWIAVYFLTALRLRFLRCPRCGKNYFDSFLTLFGGHVYPGDDTVPLSTIVRTADCGRIRTNS